MSDITESKLITRRGNLKYLEELRALSRKNRKNPTKTENIVWYQILNYKKTGFKFLRQKPINRFILDFYCRELLLAIEIDGNSHNKKRNYDEARDKFMSNLNIKTVRINNEEILCHLDEVKNKIKKIIEERKTSLFKGGLRNFGGWVLNKRVLSLIYNPPRRQLRSLGGQAS